MCNTWAAGAPGNKDQDMTGHTFRLLIVDDHPVLRQGIATLVEQAWPGGTVAEAADLPMALAAVENDPALDIVLLDLIIPGGGMEALARIGRLRPDLPVLVLASSEDLHDVRRALSSGASGYVPKSAASATLLSAIRLVLDGEIYIPPIVIDQEAARASPATPLTPRQQDVLRLVAAGHANKGIAQMLSLSEKTIKAHLATTFRTLGATNRTHAIAIARESGLI